MTCVNHKASLVIQHVTRATTTTTTWETTKKQVIEWVLSSMLLLFSLTLPPHQEISLSLSLHVPSFNVLTINGWVLNNLFLISMYLGMFSFITTLVHSCLRSYTKISNASHPFLINEFFFIFRSWFMMVCLLI